MSDDTAFLGLVAEMEIDPSALGEPTDGGTDANLPEGDGGSGLAGIDIDSEEDLGGAPSTRQLPMSWLRMTRRGQVPGNPRHRRTASRNTRSRCLRSHQTKFQTSLGQHLTFRPQGCIQQI